MALANFSLPFSGLTTQNWAATISPIQPHHATAVNSLLYGPAGHEESDEPPVGIAQQNYYKNNPYSLPQQQRSRNQYNQYVRHKKNNNYLPPSPSQTLLPSSSSSLSSLSQQRPPLSSNSQFNQHQPSNTYLPTRTQQKIPTRTYGEESYEYSPERNNGQQPPPQYFNDFNLPPTQQQLPQPQAPGITPQPPLPSSPDDYDGNQPQSQQQQPQQPDLTGNDEGYPYRPPGFTRVQAGQGSKTQVHAVLDYDADENDDEYYDQNDGENTKGKPLPTVTPIQGPIFLKNGTVPVVPLFSYPTVNNGTFVQIPIWWTALSVALGLDIRGDIIRGVPCVKRYHQLFCPTAGNKYPIDKIEKFIDDNKALMRRMYGDFEMQTTGGGGSGTSKKRRRSTDEPEPFELSGIHDIMSKAGGEDLEDSPDSDFGETYFGKLRKKRQVTNFRSNSGSPGSAGNRRNKNDRPGTSGTQENGTGRVDACESKIEIVTPYWASNSAGKIRAIVNTQHFEQAIHQEICTKVQTGRCNNDCGCEQKYKWHRLLAYDPDNDCKGIFMDWFLFPSCCVCRCSP